MSGDENDYKIGSLLAYQGRDDCTSVKCRRLDLRDDSPGCIGWHCAVCDEPSSQYGHPDCRKSD